MYVVCTAAVGCCYETKFDLRHRCIYDGGGVEMRIIKGRARRCC
jgi:hypothetical protein